MRHVRRVQQSCYRFPFFSDGNLYLFPEGKYGEAFWYYKKPFEENNIKVPTTFDEFVDAAAKLKRRVIRDRGIRQGDVAAGSLPVVHPSSSDHTEFIDKLKTGTKSLPEKSHESGELAFHARQGRYFKKASAAWIIRKP
ncbi:extracellular solute-binding protein [Cohnella faecalis]|uniref:Extracellular solute-binding protein n=1 Tax=Cohnella faecalis TaxID=2315694 RepID=A0A398CCS1_9BACL|nr:extracellular solute-binding protein [Cohnella faecalis]